MPETNNIKLGADPEFEWFDSQGRFIYASDVVGGLHNSLGTDGASCTGEIRPSPGTPAGVMRSIAAIITGANKKYGHGRYMYAGSGKVHPTGGHIHFSGVECRPELLRALDKFISVPLNEVSDTSHRRNEYGVLSSWRSQPHGWEYRAPLSWISHPVIARGVLMIAWVLANASAQGRLSEITDNASLITYAKSASTGYNAPSMIPWAINQYWKMLKRMADNHILIEQVEVFQAWRKKTPIASQTVRTIPRMQWNTEDDGIRVVKAEFERLTAGYQVRNTRSYIVCGARRDRTSANKVFVPQLPLSDAYRRDNTYALWDNPSIGLSVSIRNNPTLAAEKLIQLLAVTEATGNDNSEVLAAIEGRR